MHALRNLGMGKPDGEVTKQSMESAQSILKLFDREKGKPFNPELVVGMVACNVPCYVLCGKKFDYDDKGYHETIEVIDYVMKNADAAGMKAWSMIWFFNNDKFLYSAFVVLRHSTR